MSWLFIGLLYICQRNFWNMSLDLNHILMLKCIFCIFMNKLLYFMNFNDFIKTLKNLI